MTIQQDLGRGLIRKVIPKGLKVHTTGDSLEANGVSGSSGSIYLDQRGWMSWLQALTGHYFLHNVRWNDDASKVVGHNRATGGWYSYNVNANIGEDILAYDPQAVSICIGTNDLSGGSDVDLIWQNILEAAEMVLRHDAELWLWTVMPRSDKNSRIHGESSKGFSAANEDKRIKLNEKIRRYAAETPNVRLIDMQEDFNKDGQIFGDDYTYDGLHFNSRGAYRRAQRIIRMLKDSAYETATLGQSEENFDGLIEPRFPLDYDSSTNPDGNLLTNFDFSATGGALNGDGVAGTVPSNFTLQRETGSKSEATCEIIEEPGIDGKPTPKIKLTIKSDGTGTEKTAAFRIFTSSPSNITTNAVVGNWVETGVICELESHTEDKFVRSVYTEAKESGGRTQRHFSSGYTYTDGSATEYDYFPNEDLTLVLRTPAQKLETTNGLSWRMYVNIDETVKDEVVIKWSLPYYKELSYTPQDVSEESENVNPGVGEISGFIDYNDVTTSVTPISLSADTWTTITNDGAGAFTNKTYKPKSVTELMDVSTGQFDFSELSLGDTVFIRNDFSVTPSINNTLLMLKYILGTGPAAYTLEKIVGRLDSGSGIPYRFSLTPDLIYMGDTNTKDNLVTMQIKLSGAGTVVNAGSVVQVIKR